MIYKYWKYKTISFKLINVLIMFYYIVIIIFKNYLNIFIFIFLNNILIYLNNKEKYKKYIILILKALNKINLKIHFIKSV